MKKLQLGQQHKVFAGVLAGVAEYLKVDPVAVRVLFMAVLILTGIVPGIIVYVIAWIMIPEGTAFAPTKPSDTATTSSDDSRSV